MHFALTMQPSKSVDEYLLRENPNAIWEVDGVDWQTPLDLVMDGLRRGTTEISTLALILDTCPGAVGTEEEAGFDLLENAIATGCSQEVLEE
jgi:hypothetical protein